MPVIWGAPLSRTVGPGRLGKDHCQRHHRLHRERETDAGCCCQLDHTRTCCPEHGADNARRIGVRVPTPAETRPMGVDDLPDRAIGPITTRRVQRDGYDGEWPYASADEVVIAAASGLEVVFLPQHFDAAFTGATDVKLRAYLVWMDKANRLAEVESE